MKCIPQASTHYNEQKTVYCFAWKVYIKSYANEFFKKHSKSICFCLKQNVKFKMKSFSLIALVALFFAAVYYWIDSHNISHIQYNLRSINFYFKVVSAAPQHSSAALSSSSSHPTIREVISELSNIFTCVPNVVGQIIGDGDFKSEFTQFKQEFNAVLKHLPKCPKHEALNQKYKFVGKLQWVDIMFTFHMIICILSISFQLHNW